jgi:phosphoribosylanthranilate isomerase
LGRGVIVKICGVTSPADADGCVAMGVDWLGLNFVPSSPRCIDVATARAIAEAVHGRALLVGVVVDRAEAELLELVREARLDSLQLHGDEPPAVVRRLAPHAYKALRVGSREDVERANDYEGLLLVDAKVEGALGGTGRTVDFTLAAELSRARPILLAGGLTPKNVAEAARAVRPWGVDVASGVERSPGVKDLEAVKAFVENARRGPGSLGA